MVRTCNGFDYNSRRTGRLERFSIAVLFEECSRKDSPLHHEGCSTPMSLLLNLAHLIRENLCRNLLPHKISLKFNLEPILHQQKPLKSISIPLPTCHLIIISFSFTCSMHSEKTSKSNTQLAKTNMVSKCSSCWFFFLEHKKESRESQSNKNLSMVTMNRRKSFFFMFK